MLLQNQVSHTHTHAHLYQRCWRCVILPCWFIYIHGHVGTPDSPSFALSVYSKEAINRETMFFLPHVAFVEVLKAGFMSGGYVMIVYPVLLLSPVGSPGCAAVRVCYELPCTLRGRWTDPFIQAGGSSSQRLTETQRLFCSALKWFQSPNSHQSAGPEVFDPHRDVSS